MTSAFTTLMLVGILIVPQINDLFTEITVSSIKKNLLLLLLQRPFCSLSSVIATVHHGVNVTAYGFVASAVVLLVKTGLKRLELK